MLAKLVELVEQAGQIKARNTALKEALLLEKRGTANRPSLLYHQWTCLERTLVTT